MLILCNYGMSQLNMTAWLELHGFATSIELVWNVMLETEVVCCGNVLGIGLNLNELGMLK